MEKLCIFLWNALLQLVNPIFCTNQFHIHSEKGENRNGNNVTSISVLRINSKSFFKKFFSKILENLKKMLFLLTPLCASSLATADASVTSRKFKGKIWLLKNVASKLDLFISK